jgi:hypothetical protein
MVGKYRSIAEQVVDAVNTESNDLDAIEAVEEILNKQLIQHEQEQAEESTC